MNLQLAGSSLKTELNAARGITEDRIKIEQISKVINFILLKLCAPGVVLPALLVTSINFLIYDLGDKSYFLPLPIMYANILF